MDHDLIDLLSAWRGSELDPERCERLFARLRQDDALLQAFVEEVRMLGMLKAVQSTEPRWLALQEELGWRTAPGSAKSEDSEDKVMERIFRPSPRGTWKLRMWGSVAATLVLVGAASLWWFRGHPEKPPALSASADAKPGSGIALISKLDGVQWETRDTQAPSEGTLLLSGRLALRSGKVILTFLNGVTLTMEGPADVDLVSTDKVFCRWGKLRARVPKGAEGFVITSPGSAVVDLGTEFGLNVEPNGKSRVIVFEGLAEAALLDASGLLQRTQVVEQSKEFEIDPGSGQIVESVARPEGFVSPPSLDVPSLKLNPAYRNTVLKSRPQSYWRFETENAGSVPNEVTGGTPLRVNGPVRISGTHQGNGFALFKSGAPEQFMDTNGLWKLSREPGHAVELWFLAESISYASLFGLYPTEEALPKNGKHKYAHAMLLELTAQGRQSLDKPASVRLLRRWPADLGMPPKVTSNDPYSILMELKGVRQKPENQPATVSFLHPQSLDFRVGTSVFSQNPYIPRRWYHLVAQKEGDRIDLYVNGIRDHSMTLDSDRSNLFCHLVVGRRTADPLDLTDTRPFVGRLDELAFYDHSLSPQEIRRHFEMAIP